MGCVKGSKYIFSEIIFLVARIKRGRKITMMSGYKLSVWSRTNWCDDYNWN